MPIQVYRVQTEEDAELIYPLVDQFHERVVGLRYPLVWSRTQMAEGARRHRDVFIFAAYDDDRDAYVGYLWAQANAAGELYVYQFMSLIAAAGRALTDALQLVSDTLGVKDWNGLVTLRPGEAAMILQHVPRIHRFCTRFGAAPESIWVTKRMGRNGQ
jgi:hypothetical protein